MKTYVYTLEDECLGIPVTIEGELIDYQDNRVPFIVIQDISYGDKPLEMWCISEPFVNHCKNKIFQEWCSEVRHA